MDLPKIAIFVAFFALVALAFEIFFFRRRRNTEDQGTTSTNPSSSRKRNIIIGVVLLLALLPLGLFAVFQQVRTQKEAAPVAQTPQTVQTACDQIDLTKNNAVVTQGSTLAINDIVSIVGYCYITSGSLAKFRFSLKDPSGKVVTTEFLAFAAPQKSNETKQYFQATDPYIKLSQAGSYTVQVWGYSNDAGLSKDPFTKTFTVSASSISTPLTLTPTPTLVQLPQTGSTNNPPDCLSLSAIPLTGPAPLTVSLTGSGSDKDGQVSAFEFTFGDGAKQTINKTPAASSSASTSHTYQTSGNYTASLRVEDNSGSFNNPSALCSVQLAVATSSASISANLKAQSPKTTTPTPTSATLPEAGISLPMVGFVTGGLLLLTFGLLLAF